MEKKRVFRQRVTESIMKVQLKQKQEMKNVTKLFSAVMMISASSILEVHAQSYVIVNDIKFFF